VAKSKSNTATTTPSREPHFIVRYFQETRAELRKVTWPTREEAQNLTLIIVGVSVAMAAFLGLLEVMFQQVVGGIILGNLMWIVVGIVIFLACAAAFYFNSRQE
jgi:preprotein translocase subunit SecE